MSTILELPDELLREVHDRAARSGQGFTDVVVRLLNKGLEAEREAAAENAIQLKLARRRELTQRFVSGELGVELAGIEESRERDRRAAVQRAGE